MILAAFDGRALLVVLVVIGLIFWAAVERGKPDESTRRNNPVAPGGNTVARGRHETLETPSDLRVWGSSPDETCESEGESTWGQNS